MRTALEDGRFDVAHDAARVVDASSWRSDPRVRVALGELAMFDEDLDRAERELTFAVRADPRLAAAWHDLGAIAQWRRHYERSIEYLRRALMIAPDASSSAMALARSYFALGRYPEGWSWYEHRRGGQLARPRQRGLWDGSAQPHASLAIFAEEGYGDVIQFCRYIANIRERVARVYLVLDGFHAPLAPLLASLQGVDKIVTDRRTGPAMHACCPLLTLAHFAGASPERPMTVPYLSAPPGRVERWRDALGDRRGLRVGFAWAGNPSSNARTRAIDQRRSIDPALFGPLMGVAGIEWHSLQVGSGLSKRNRFPAGVRIVDHAHAIGDFADTAALIANLDLTITVDTSVAHVAGAIGAPVFVLNRFDSCWRWGPSGERTPWYPTMRLFRQHSFGEWNGAIDDAATALSRWQHPLRA